jgi:hypothetical protein
MIPPHSMDAEGRVRQAVVEKEQRLYVKEFPKSEGAAKTGCANSLQKAGHATVQQ